MAVNFVTVTSFADSGPGSLRAVIDAADLSLSNSTVISFAAGGTVVLGSTLMLRANITIDGDTNGDGKADVTISGNDVVRIFDADQSGTAITLRSLNIVDGDTPFTNGSGGALIVRAGVTATVANSTMSGNHADNAGGAIYSDGTLRIVNSTLSGNDADVRGGAIYVTAGKSVEMVNTTITGNDGGQLGGGIAVGVGSSITATNTTISGNHVANEGGGIELSESAALTIVNTIVSGNTSTSGLNPNVVRFGPPDGTITAGNSIVGTDVTITTDNGNNIVSNAAAVGALADNGGVVRTMAPTSLAIDKGTDIASDPLDANRNGVTFDPLSVDARGGARKFGPKVDIGAHEALAKAIVSGSVTEDSATTTTQSLALNTFLGTATVSTARAGDLGDAGSMVSVAAGGTVIAGRYGALTLFADGFYTYALDNADADTNALSTGEIVSDVFTFRIGSAIADSATISIEVTGNTDVPPVNVITGTRRGEKIDGKNGPNGQRTTDDSDFVNAKSGDDSVKALGGDDTVRGGTGIDKLEGGTGIDSVDYTDHTGDLILSLAKKGFNAVRVDGSIGDQIKGFENVIGGRGDDVLTGNGDANMLVGGRGDDTLNGGDGDDILDGGLDRDVLIGGDGADQFRFTVPPSTKSADRVLDFKSGEDKIVLAHADFAVLGSMLEAGELVSKSGKKPVRAEDADDHLIYNRKTGALTFDSDGNGADKGVLIATFEGSKHPNLGIDDFVIV